MQGNIDASRMRSGAVSPFVLLAVLGSCSTQPGTTKTTVDQSFYEQLSKDSQYMMKAFGVPAGMPESSHAIDLSDPGQHSFVMNRLLAAGKTPGNSPHLFDRLQQVTDKAIARRKAGLVTANAAAPTDWCASFIMFGGHTVSGQTATFTNTHPLVSCNGGAIYVYADVTTYNSNLNDTQSFVVASAAGEDYSGGTNFQDVTISPSLPYDATRVNKTDSLVIADDDTGNEQVTYNVYQNGIKPTAYITLQHPTWHSGLNNNGYIYMCQLRNETDYSCDYGVGSLTNGVFSPWTPNAAGRYTGIAEVKLGVMPWAGNPNVYFPLPADYIPNDMDHGHVYLPTQGSLTVTEPMATCKILNIVGAKFRLIKSITGGVCTTTTSFTSAFPPNPLPGNSNVVAFKGTSDFVNDGGTGSANCAYTQIINEEVDTAMTITAQVDCGNGTETVITSATANGTKPVPYEVNFRNSCFAEGTAIRRPGGSTVKVETIKVGDKVMSDSKGTVLTVVGVSHGMEEEPLVALQDNQGHEVRLTSTHPVVKASGEVVFASVIAEDDRVMTDRGVAKIVSVARIPYPGQVYNLKLGTAEERSRIGRHSTTMFAGGFLVGDSTMQQDITTPHRTVVQRSAAWSRDYENALAGVPAMKRTIVK